MSSPCLASKRTWHRIGHALLTFVMFVFLFTMSTGVTGDSEAKAARWRPTDRLLDPEGGTGGKEVWGTLSRLTPWRTAERDDKNTPRQRDARTRSAPSLILALLLCVMLAAPAGARAEAVSHSPVLRRLLPPLALVLALMISGAGALLWRQHQIHLNERMTALNARIVADFENDKQQLAAGLAAAAQLIAADPRVHQALPVGDIDRLLSDWRPVYEDLYRKHKISHFNFHDRKHRCIVRVHNPKEHGDHINRFTLLEAERTGGVSSGIELGARGMLCYRVAQPVFQGGELLGFVELGKEIEDVLRGLHTRFGCLLTVAIGKTHLHRAPWEEGMRLLGRHADWDRLSHSVIVYASGPPLPDAVASMVDVELEAGMAQGGTIKEIPFDGRAWRAFTIDLHDASSKPIGCLLVMSDITSQKAAFHGMLILGGVLGALLLSLLMGFVIVILRRTDQSILAQQAELRAIEGQEASILSAIGEGIIAVDARAGIVLMNPMAELLTGWSQAEALGQSIDRIFRMIDRETGAELESPAAPLLRQEAAALPTVHASLIARDGRERPVACCRAPIPKEPDTISGVVLAFRDQTEACHAADREKYLRQLLLSIRKINQIITLETDPARLIQQACATLAETMGFHQAWIALTDDALHRVTKTAFAGLDGRFESLRERLLRGEMPVCMQRASRQDELVTIHDPRTECADCPLVDCYAGQPSWTRRIACPDRAYGVLTAAVPGRYVDDAEGRDLFNEMVADLAFGLRRIEKDQEILMSRNLLATAEAIAHLGSWSLDLTTRRLTWSDEVYRIFGLEPHEFAATYESFLSIVHPDDRAAVDAAYSTSLREGKDGYEIEHRLIRRGTGETRHAHERCRHIRDATGRVVHSVGSVHDVTERRRADEELRESNYRLELAISQSKELAQKAEASNRAKTLFLSNMSHEIRTPLNAVIGFSQLLARDPLLTPRQRSDIQIIQQSGHDLLEIINDVLEISKIEAGRVELNSVDFSFHELLGELEWMFRSRCDAKGLRLVVERSDPLPDFLSGDRTKLKQVFVNLLGNAVKYTAHGSITMRVRGDVYPADATEGEAGMVWLAVEVEDSGIGISKEDQTRIFQPFEQAHTSHPTSGTGLGLAISREFVKMMKGDIRVTSELDKGSCFRFTAELKQGASVAVKPRPVRRRVLGLEPGTGPVRVLVVDDNAVIQVLLKALLVPIGFDIRQAFDGKQALELFEQFSPHVVLMDMRMPEMDGYEATRRIKSTAAGRSTPVIALTASAFEEGRQKTMEAGVDAYIRKPFQHEELYSVLEHYLGLRYVYENGLIQEKPPALTTEAVSALPEALRADLRQTLEQGDMTRFSAILEQVDEIHVDVVRSLQRLAASFDYRRLDALLGRHGSGDEH